MVVVFVGLLALRTAMTNTIADRQKSDKSTSHYASFEVGECMTVPIDAVTTSDMLRTDCNLEHDAEIIAIKRPDDKKPGLPLNTERLIDMYCNTAFKAYVKHSRAAQNYDVWGAYRETLDFQPGATSVLCFASLASGETMNTAIKSALAGK